MAKQTAVLVLGLTLLALASAQGETCTGADYLVQNSELFLGFCAHTCEDPIFDFCPATIYIPPGLDHADYCGKKNGTWANYTYVCQACNNKVQSFYYGFCSCDFVQCPAGYHCEGGNCKANPTCDDITCGDDQTCEDAKCIDIPVPPPECTSNEACQATEVCDSTTQKCRAKTCADITCPDPLDTCEFGYCFRKYDHFCSKSQPSILRHYCPLPLLTYEQCPTTYFVVPPEMTVCAVTETGEFIDYAAECEPCRVDRHYIMYYYDQPCSTIPKRCPSDLYQCIDGTCEAKDACKGIKCGDGKECNNGVCVAIPGYCYNDFNCPFGKVCQDNACIDPVDLCDGVYCLIGKCYQGQCVDNCFNVFCGEGQTCVEGQCQDIVIPDPQPQPECSLNSDCNPNQVCTEGNCVTIDIPRCPVTPCQPGHLCTTSGLCITNVAGICFTNKECPADQICLGNRCKKMTCDSTKNSAQILLSCYGNKCVNNLCQNPYYA